MDDIKITLEVIYDGQSPTADARNHTEFISIEDHIKNEKIVTLKDSQQTNSINFV